MVKKRSTPVTSGRNPANCIKMPQYFWRISPQTNPAIGVMIVPAKELCQCGGGKERKEERMRIMRRTQKGTVISEADCVARKGKSLFLICRYGRYEDMDTVIEIPELSSMEQEQLENELLEKGYLDISRYNWAVYEFFFGVVQDWLDIQEEKGR